MTEGSLTCITFYCELLKISKALRLARVKDRTVLPAIHAFIHKWNEPYMLYFFNSQPQSVTALWLVLISRSAEDWRLSWPGWLGEILSKQVGLSPFIKRLSTDTVCAWFKLRWFARPKTVTHPSIGAYPTAKPLDYRAVRIVLPRSFSRAVEYRHRVY